MGRTIFRTGRLLAAAIAAVSSLATAVSCGNNLSREQDNGLIRVYFSDSWSSLTRAELELPDTNDFILVVSDGAGKEIYSGPFGASPETFEVPSGSYMVSVRSCTFDAPAFSCPVFGDDRCVMVPEGGTVSVCLECMQVNSGIRLRIDPDFLTAYPDGVLFVGSDDGRLMYSYSEKRIAYFNPGKVSLIMSDGTGTSTLLTRWLAPCEVLTLDIDVPDEGSGVSGNAITVSVDTTRIWTEDSYTIGDDDPGQGSQADKAFSVSQAKTMAGAKDVWVTGFIVGGDLTQSAMSTVPPFKSESNLAIASRSSVSDKESCIAVQLPDGDVREALNLVTHPDLLGRQVWLKGDIVEAYFGITGLKSTDEFILK